MLFSEYPSMLGSWGQNTAPVMMHCPLSIENSGAQWTNSVSLMVLELELLASDHVTQCRKHSVPPSPLVIVLSD